MILKWVLLRSQFWKFLLLGNETNHKYDLMLIFFQQDWEFPHFMGDVDVNLPGLHTPHMQFKIPFFQKIFKEEYRIHITGMLNNRTPFNCLLSKVCCKQANQNIWEAPIQFSLSLKVVRVVWGLTTINLRLRLLTALEISMLTSNRQMRIKRIGKMFKTYMLFNHLGLKKKHVTSTHVPIVIASR